MAESTAFKTDSDCRGLVATVIELHKNDYWKRNRKSLHSAFEQALKDIETLKTEVAALKG